MFFVSVHIPKTAGTSFARALEQAFDPSELVLDYQHVRDHAEVAGQGVNPVDTHRAWLSPGWMELVRRYRDDRRSLGRTCQMVHGHFPVLKYHPLLTWRRPFYITWVRDPFARAVSNYFYWQSFKADTVPDPLVRMVLSERWSLEAFLFHEALRDYQSLFLKGVPWRRIDFIGVVERYSEDLQRLSGLIGRPLELYTENKGPVSGAVEAHAHLRERFMDFHGTDAALYDYAVNHGGRAPGA